jgi:hypothetical protein
MRRGISLFVACVVVALVACASEDLPQEKLAGSPSPGADVTGSWTATWGPLVGTNSYPDTLKNSLNQDSIVTRTVRDTCTGTGTLTLTQGTPVAYVTGTYAITRTCRSHLLKHSGADSVFVGQGVTTPTGSIYNGNMGSGHLSFSLDNSVAARELQLGLVSGNSMDGTAQWAITMATRPTKGRGTVRGTFGATK